MTLPIIYIHGAFSSGLSFARIIEKLPEHQHHVVEYTVDEPLSAVIAKVDELVNQIGSVNIVSHSLGGLVAVSVAQRNPGVKAVFTMGTPFGGSKAATTLVWFNTHELYQSLNSHGAVLRKIHSTKTSCKIRSIITTVGNNPMMTEANDGVVSVTSQMALKGTEQIKVPINHFEVLMSDHTITLIEEFLF